MAVPISAVVVQYVDVGVIIVTTIAALAQKHR